MPKVESRVPLSERARNTLEYENEDLVGELVRTHGLSVLRAFDDFHEAKMFLLFCILREGKEEPVPPEIDKVLHAFFDLPSFTDFCKNRLKGTIEHVPHEQPIAAKERLRMLERARELFGSRFNERQWARGLPACTLKFVAH